MPRLDELTTEEVLRLCNTDVDQVFRRACKVLPDLLFNEFNCYSEEDWYPDLVQEGCLGVMRAIETWNPESSSLTTWAYRLAKQNIIKEVRRQIRFYEHHETVDFEEKYDDEMESPGNPNDAVHGGVPYGQRAMEWGAEYSLLKQRVTPLERVVLDMLLKDYTQTEIAEKVQRDQSTISRIVVKIQQDVAKIQQRLAHKK